MLIGTQAPTMPGITLSNYTPISKLGFRYEVFMAHMGRVENIAFEGRTTSGNPRLFGVQVSIDPVRGWTLSASRLLQYGGGERDDSLGSLWRAFFNPTNYDNISDDETTDEEFGNQTAALTSQFVFPAAHPFAVYFQYAGEDGSRAEGWRLGNDALSVGLDLPRLWNRFDLTYEATDWQNGWNSTSDLPAGSVQRRARHRALGWRRSGAGRWRGRSESQLAHRLDAVRSVAESSCAIALCRTRTTPRSTTSASTSWPCAIRAARSGSCTAPRSMSAATFSVRTSGASAASCVSCQASPSPASASWSRGTTCGNESSSSSTPG